LTSLIAFTSRCQGPKKENSNNISNNDSSEGNKYLFFRISFGGFPKQTHFDGAKQIQDENVSCGEKGANKLNSNSFLWKCFAQYKKKETIVLQRIVFSFFQ